MRFIITSLIFILYFSNLFSQNRGIVYYGQIESIKLKGPHGPDFNAVLAFNHEASYYVTAKDSLDSHTSFKRVYDNADGTQGISFSTYTTPIGRQVYNNLKTDSLYWNKWRTFYVAEKTPKINWKLEKESKQIGTLLAYKATGQFRGRNYTAWYTLDIPLPFGPWKLQGLPGLILEAYDEHKEMYIYFKNIEYPTQNKTPIKPIIWPIETQEKWRTLSDYKIRLNDIYERMKSSSISVAQMLDTEIPEQQIKSEVFLESFKD